MLYLEEALSFVCSFFLSYFSSVFSVRFGFAPLWIGVWILCDQEENATVYFDDNHHLNFPDDGKCSNQTIRIDLNCARWTSFMSFAANWDRNKTHNRCVCMWMRADDEYPHKNGECNKDDTNQVLKIHSNKVSMDFTHTVWSMVFFVSSLQFICRVFVSVLPAI